MVKSTFLQVCLPNREMGKVAEKLSEVEIPTISDNYERRPVSTLSSTLPAKLSEGNGLTIFDNNGWSVFGIATLAEALAIQERWTVEHGPSVCGMLANGTFYVRPRWWKPFVNPRRTIYRQDGEANNG